MRRIGRFLFLHEVNAAPGKCHSICFDSLARLVCRADASSRPLLVARTAHPARLLPGRFFDFLDFIRSFQQTEDLRQARLNAFEIAHYYLLQIPGMLGEIVIPVSLLLALLYALTNHARHQELTAIRAAGASLWRLFMPYWVVGILVSLLLYQLNEYWGPQSTEL